MATARMAYGEVELALAGSYGDGDGGVGGSLGYTFLGRKISCGALVRALSNHYSNLSLSPIADRPTIEGMTHVAFPLGSRVSMTLQYTGMSARDAGTRHRVGALASIRVASRANLVATMGYQNQRGQDLYEGLLSFTYFFGHNTTATLTQTQQNEHWNSDLRVQRPMALGPDYGYRLDLQAGKVERVLALAQGQTDFGRYEASYERIGDRNSALLSAAGAFALLGGRVFATRPVSDSFAVIQVPGVKGVRTYLNNQPVGRTNRKGDLFVPNLLSYYGNRLGIADEDVPLAYEVQQTEVLVAPPFRGGARALFDVRRVQPVAGKVVVERAGERTVPQYGELTVQVGDKTISSPLGRDGEFYLEDMPVGRYPASVEYEHGICKFRLVLRGSKGGAASEAVVAKIGTQRCVIDEPKRDDGEAAARSSQSADDAKAGAKRRRKGRAERRGAARGSPRRRGKKTPSRGTRP